MHVFIEPRKDEIERGKWGGHTFDFLLRQGSQANSVRPELRLGCGWRLEDIRRSWIVEKGEKWTNGALTDKINQL